MSIYTPEVLQKEHHFPDEIMPFVRAHPRLLPGETKDDYYKLFDMMALEVLPNDDMEWLAVVDLTHLQWDIQRFRRWKNAIIATNRAAALEHALSKTHRGIAQSGAMPQIRAESKMYAREMSASPSAHRELHAQLEAHGYDAEAINAGAFVQSIVPLTTIEGFLSSTRRQVLLTLREIEIRRELQRRALEAVTRRQAERKEAEKTQVEAK